MDELLELAARHWAIRRSADGSRWWHHPIIQEHIDRLIFPDGGGFNGRLARIAPAAGFPRALSVGCGTGGLEAKLIKAGIVQTFDLFEIGEFRRDQIQSKAAEHGVSDRVAIHIGDAFEQKPHGEFDLVYWNNSLHHMFDAQKAVNWSRDALRAGGYFVINDFVGPSRFQWSDDDLKIASRVRELLPDRFLRHPKNKEASLDWRLQRPSIEHMMQTDPTEAADSSGILPAIMEAFPAAEIIPTGGIIYHLALNDVLANFEDQDVPLLQSLLLLDETLARSGRTHYAVAIARKP